MRILQVRHLVPNLYQRLQQKPTALANVCSTVRQQHGQFINQVRISGACSLAHGKIPELVCQQWLGLQKENNLPLIFSQHLNNSPPPITSEGQEYWKIKDFSKPHKGSLYRPPENTSGRIGPILFNTNGIRIKNRWCTFFLLSASEIKDPKIQHIQPASLMA